MHLICWSFEIDEQTITQAKQKCKFGIGLFCPFPHFRHEGDYIITVAIKPFHDEWTGDVSNITSEIHHVFVVDGNPNVFNERGQRSYFAL